MPARPNTLISRQKAISSKRQKPAGLRRRGQDGRNLIRRIQPPPPSLQKRSVALRLEREERGTQWKDCFPRRENFSMFIRDIGLPDESGRGGGRLTQTAKHAGEAEPQEPQEPHKQNVLFWKQQQEAGRRVLPFCMQEYLHACFPFKRLESTRSV